MIAVSRAAAGDRQQQEEEGDAGDRVEDARWRRASGGRSQRRRCGEQRQREGDREAERDRDDDELEVLRASAST